MENCEEINDESDNIGYYTRSKRRRLENDDEKYTNFHHSERKRKNPIVFLPVEILQAILKHVSHQELSENIRLVNHRFKIIAEDILNRSFKEVEKKLAVLISTTEMSLQCTEDDMEIKRVAKLLNMLEILKLQHCLVVATVWRYIYNTYYKTPRTCIFAGQLIDAHINFMEKFLHSPNILFAPAMIRDYALPPEVTKVVQLTKSFCIHFDKVIEEVMENCLICSGCKIIDIVDCAQYIQKSVIYERTNNNFFEANYNYFFRNSWFVALPVTVTKEMEWSQRQRMMHMRLRRIVMAHNDMFLQQDQYEREAMLRSNPVISRIKKPGNNVYTGYGEVGNLFYFYGVMNDGAYNQKFVHDEDQEDQEEEEEGNEDVVDEQEDIQRNNSDEDVFYRIPHLGFKMNVIVQCPLLYAPLKYLNTLDDSQLQKLKNKNGSNELTHIRVIFECDGASYPRLPTRYEYSFNPNRLID